MLKFREVFIKCVRQRCLVLTETDIHQQILLQLPNTVPNFMKICSAVIREITTADGRTGMAKITGLFLQSLVKTRQKYFWNSGTCPVSVGEVYSSHKR